MNQSLILILLFSFGCAWCSLLHAQQSDVTAWWNPAVAQRLTEAEDNQPQMRAALRRVNYEHRRALEFLIEHMPASDLTTLTAEYLLDNIELAYQAINQVPWGKQIPEDVFFNDVLPYANVDETREDWRHAMMERCLPIIKNCRTPGEAAQKLNREVFPLIKVRYATSRKKANQSPSESMAQSVASCTGLSIILTDACRSVGVPSRLAGIPSWTNKRGNHTWVEVWDDGWHFTGAAEPADKLNQTWFQADAAQADNNKPIHRIYAVSFAKTGMYFPLVWSRRSQEVNAVNVTQRYTEDRVTPDPHKSRVLISMLSSDGKRVEQEIIVTGSDAVEFKGRTRGESADMNDILMLELPRDQTWKVSWQENGATKTVERKTTNAEQNWWELRLGQ